MGNLNAAITGYRTHILVAILIALGLWEDVAANGLAGIDAEAIKNTLTLGLVSTVKAGIDRVGAKGA